MHVADDSNHPPAAAYLRLRRVTRRTIREQPMSDVPNLGEKIPRSDADV